MLNETEAQALAQLVDHYGLGGILDGLATLALQRQALHGTAPAGLAWGHDARLIRRTIPRLYTEDSNRRRAILHPDMEGAAWEKRRQA